MGVEELLKDLERSHSGLQHLRIEATEGNLNIIIDALTTLKKAHALISIISKPTEASDTKDSGDDDAS